MDKSLEQKAEQLVKERIKNLELICYFKRSTKKTPIFLGVINKSYAEIKILLNKGLIIGLEPIKSYEFNIDKLENFFYQKYQERIDNLKDEIWRKKRTKNQIIGMTDDLEPNPEDEDFEEKMRAVIEFAKKSIEQLDEMEEDKEEYNFEIGDLQEKQKADPYYKLLFYIRNDKDIVFNKRTEDNEGIVHKRILKYVNDCFQGEVVKTMTFLRKRNFYKQFSPAKNYYISELGLALDAKIKQCSWESDDYNKTEEELAQEAEINKLKEELGF